MKENRSALHGDFTSTHFHPKRSVGETPKGTRTTRVGLGYRVVTSDSTHTQRSESGGVTGAHLAPGNAGHLQ